MKKIFLSLALGLFLVGCAASSKAPKHEVQQCQMCKGECKCSKEKHCGCMNKEQTHQCPMHKKMEQQKPACGCKHHN